MYPHRALGRRIPEGVWDRRPLDEQLRISQSQVGRLLTPRAVTRLKQAGYLPAFPTTKPTIDWLLQSELVDFNGSVALCQNAHDPAANLPEWIEPFTTHRQDGFLYDQVTSTALLLIGVQGLITGVLHVTRIQTGQGRHTLALEPLARLLPVSGQAPLPKLFPTEDPTLRSWAAQHLGARYRVRPGAHIAI